MFATYENETLTAPGVSIRVNDIKSTWSALSFYEERRAAHELQWLGERLNQFAAKADALAAHETVCGSFDAEAEKAQFCLRHVALTRAYWASLSRTMSWFITGPANFPTARNEKRQRWADAKRQAVAHHVKKAMAALERRAFPFGHPDGPVRSNNPDAIELLRADLAKRQEKQDYMKAVNAAWRKAGSPKADNNEGWAKVRETFPRLSESMTSVLRSSMARCYYDAPPFEQFSLSNNNANMKRIADRIAHLERVRAMPEKAPEQVDTKAGAVQIVENADAYRIQLIFPGKPAPDVRAVLKSHGFRWAPSEGAWQRHLNNEGRYAAQCVIKKLEAA